MQELIARVDARQLTPWTRDRADPARRLSLYLGCPQPSWLTVADVPLFISASRLARYTTTGDEWPTRKAATFGCGVWALDSGSFTELQQHGRWRDHPDVYGGMVTRFVEEVGAPPRFVSPQDWMCEPWVIAGGTHQGQRFAGTGFSLRDHIELTVANYLYLRDEFYFLPWAPVLQGWQLDDYLLCEQMYLDAGVDLAAAPVVGLGSVCRRQATSEIGQIVETFWRRGYRLHGYGIKADGLRLYGHMLSSADSMAWSRIARPDRANIRLPGCSHRGTCNNCLRWALVWREQVLEALREPRQLTLDISGVATGLSAVGDSTPSRVGSGTAFQPLRISPPPDANGNAALHPPAATGYQPHGRRAPTR